MLRRLRSEGSAASPENNNTTTFPKNSTMNKSNILQSKLVNPASNNNTINNNNNSSSAKALLMSKPQNSAANNNSNPTAGTPSSTNYSSHLPKAVLNEIQLISNTIVRCDDRIQASKTWERRHDALLRAKELFLQNRSICTCSDFLTSIATFKDGLNFQLCDIRSQIAKEACVVVDALVSCAAGALNICEIIVDWFLGTLLQLAGNTAAVVATAAVECIKKICIRGRINRDGLSTIYKTCNDKHNATRTLAYDALLMMLHFAVEKNLLAKQLTSISLALRNGFMDKLPAIRLRARVACWALDAVAHEAAVNLLAGCEVVLKKQVLEEERTYALWISRGVDIFSFSVEDAVEAVKQGLTPAYFSSLQQQQQHQQQQNRRNSTMNNNNNNGEDPWATWSETSHPAVNNNNNPSSNVAQQQRQGISTSSPSSTNNLSKLRKNNNIPITSANNNKSIAGMTNGPAPTDIVSNYMSVFGSPTMKIDPDLKTFTSKKQYDQKMWSRNNNQDDDNAVVVDEDEIMERMMMGFNTNNNNNNNGDNGETEESSWLAPSSPQKSRTARGLIMKNGNSIQQQQQQQGKSESKWTELSLDYADSDWKRKIQVLGQIEGVVLGDDKAEIRNALAENQVKIELPGSGTYVVEPGGSLLPLAEVLYEAASVKTLRPLTGDGHVLRSPTKSSSGSATSFRTSTFPAPSISSLPPFFRKDPANVKPEEVVDLILRGVEDSHPKICLAGLTSLAHVLDRAALVVSTSIERIFKALFQRLGDMKEEVRSRTVEVLTLLRRRVQSERIVPVLLGRILDLVNHRIRLACLEYLHSGIPFFDGFFQSSNHMRASLLRLITMSQKVHNVDITQATVACLARLAERHRDLFVNSLMSFDLKDQNKILAALSIAVPYLSQDIRRKHSREPLLLQAAADTSLTYSLFLAPGENSTKGQKFGGSSTAVLEDSAVASPQLNQISSNNYNNSNAIRAGSIPTRLSQRMQERNNNNSNHQDPMNNAMMNNQQQQQRASSISSANGNRRSQSPQKTRKSYFQSSSSSSNNNINSNKEKYFASDLLNQQQKQLNHPADGNMTMNQQDSHQQQQNETQAASWFHNHKLNPPHSAVQHWASNRQDPPAIVAVAAAVTADDKLSALDQLQNADASVWLDNFKRVAPFPIALCRDDTDHRVRCSAIRCTRLVMTAPALVMANHHQHSDVGILEEAVRAVSKCLDDSFPDVRSEAMACLNETFQNFPVHQQQHQKRKSMNSIDSTNNNNMFENVVTFGYSLLSAMLVVCWEIVKSASSSRSDALKFLIKNLVSVYCRGAVPLSSKSNSITAHQQKMMGAKTAIEIKSSTKTILPELCRFLIVTFSHDNPDVRKLIVGAFVELLVQTEQNKIDSASSAFGVNNNNVDEDEDDEVALLKNFSGLGTAQLRLIDIYWNRALDITNMSERKDVMKRMRELGVIKNNSNV